MPGPKNYGIIYNWDGAPHGYSAVPQSMDDFLDKVYAPLIDTQVGCPTTCPIGTSNLKVFFRSFVSR